MIRLLTVSHEASTAIGSFLIAAFSDTANSGKVGPATSPASPLAGSWAGRSAASWAASRASRTHWGR